jgi:hypothetical protein
MNLTKKQVEDLRKFVELQGDNGNWNYDEYMYGMYNGMEFMLSIVEDREPVFKEKPEEFLRNKTTKSFPVGTIKEDDDLSK